MWTMRGGPCVPGGRTFLPFGPCSEVCQTRSVSQLRSVAHGGNRRRRPSAGMGRRFKNPTWSWRYPFKDWRRAAMGGYTWVFEVQGDGRKYGNCKRNSGRTELRVAQQGQEHCGSEVWRVRAAFAMETAVHDRHSARIRAPGVGNSISCTRLRQVRR